jgi:endonuclease/exonuclease/phosphatase family metal-dependent hydrolase
MTWNAHLAEGDLADLIARLRDGSLTDGRPVRRFVLLIQELFRRGADVPAFAGDSRSASAIKARDAEAPDARARAEVLGLSMLYVPSMRNGAEILEDRGNAIVSTEPLVDPFALELPLERQRRVVVGATIIVSASGVPLPLNLVNVHFEPLSSPATLWVFRNPRQRQIAAVLELLRSPRFEPSTRSAGTVLGGDFNTIQGGVEEVAYMHARTWAHSLVAEDERSTHRMGRIDYLFFRLAGEWTGSTVRVDEKFGSDHHPVLGRFAPRSQTP